MNLRLPTAKKLEKDPGSWSMAWFSARTCGSVDSQGQLVVPMPGIQLQAVLVCLLAMPSALSSSVATISDDFR